MTHEVPVNFEDFSVVTEMYRGEGVMTTELIYVGSHDGWEKVEKNYAAYDLDFTFIDAVIIPTEESFEGTLGTVIRTYVRR